MDSVSGLPPSQERDNYWIDAWIPKAVQFFFSGKSTGKWLLFVNREDVDEVWTKVVKALHAGELGFGAKVSTVRPNSLSRNPTKHVICVYTRDAEDRTDVIRVRDALSRLGFVQPIAYKTDKATGEGKYQVHGDSHIAKYWE